MTEDKNKVEEKKVVSKLLLDEEETWKDDMRAMTNLELLNQTHLYRARFDMMKNEVNRRVMQCLEMDGESDEYVKVNLTPAAKRVILLKIGKPDGDGNATENEKK